MLGLFTDEQVRGWSVVTDAVHQRGGIIFAQRLAYPVPSHIPTSSRAPTACASAINPGDERPRHDGPATTTPRRERATCADTVNDFATAAANAVRAGFDGVRTEPASAT